MGKDSGLKNIWITISVQYLTKASLYSCINPLWPHSLNKSCLDILATEDVTTEVVHRTEEDFKTFGLWATNLGGYQNSVRLGSKSDFHHPRLLAVVTPAAGSELDADNLDQCWSIYLQPTWCRLWPHSLHAERIHPALQPNLWKNNEKLCQSVCQNQNMSKSLNINYFIIVLFKWIIIWLFEYVSFVKLIVYNSVFIVYI